MMAQTSKRTPAKGKGHGCTPPAAKGCSCQRSQCIKNYCDCYQSMMACTQFCRCVGCRNTEERLVVEPPPLSRNSMAKKRDRAGFIIPEPQVSNDSVAPINIIPTEATGTDEVRTTEIDPYQVGRLIIAEFTKCFIEICEELFDLFK